MVTSLSGDGPDFLCYPYELLPYPIPCPVEIYVIGRDWKSVLRPAVRREQEALPRLAVPLCGYMVPSGVGFDKMAI